jgi:hypothetical protein
LVLRPGIRTQDECGEGHGPMSQGTTERCHGRDAGTFNRHGHGKTTDADSPPAAA